MVKIILTLYIVMTRSLYHVIKRSINFGTYTARSLLNHTYIYEIKKQLLTKTLEQ